MRGENSGRILPFFSIRLRAPHEGTITSALFPPFFFSFLPRKKNCVSLRTGIESEDR